MWYCLTVCCRETTVSPTSRNGPQAVPKSSESQKSAIHAPAFLAFAMQMLLNTRYCAKRAKLLFSAFEQTEGCLYAANSLEATPHN
jgi:hypothetical protein